MLRDYAMFMVLIVQNGVYSQGLPRYNPKTLI